MGISSNDSIKMINEIQNYYFFQKKLELILKNGKNSFFGPRNSHNKIETIYIIDKDWINDWKKKSRYNYLKKQIDETGFTDEKKLLEYIKHICQDPIKKRKLIYDSLPFNDNLSTYKSFILRNKLDLEQFECLVDEKTFNLFKKRGYKIKNKNTNIEGIITNRMISLLIKEKFKVKILYYGNIEDNYELIQLTAQCLKFNENGDHLNESEKSYNHFKHFLQINSSEDLIDFFNDNNIGFYKSVNCRIDKIHLIVLNNENLFSKYLEKEKKINNINFQNVNKFRQIGLVNVGATCYMNATLQCFINVDDLTRYLLNENNYNNIINNINKYELTSAYCELLANICCDEKIIN